MSTTPVAGIQELAAQQASPELVLNPGLRQLEQLSRGVILDKDLATPPGSPADGAAYIVAASPTGAWSGHATHIAYWNGTAWKFIAPGALLDGYSVWVVDEARRYRWTNSGPFWAVAIDSQLITDATTARTLSLADMGGYLRMTSGSSNTVTVPPNSSVPVQIGQEIRVRQAGAGATSIAAGVGVTINNTSLSVGGQHKTVTLRKVATDTWDLIA